MIYRLVLFMKMCYNKKSGGADNAADNVRRRNAHQALLEFGSPRLRSAVF